MNLQILDWQNPLWSQTLRKLHHDIYHLPDYVYLEAKRTRTTAEAVVIEDSENIFFVSYLLRSCDDIFEQTEIFDITSPYGYSGVLLSETASNNQAFINYALAEIKQLFKSKGICSAFLRLHPILTTNPTEIFPSDNLVETGETVSIDLTLSESQIWAHTRKGHQSTINKCKRLGFTSRMVSVTDNIEIFKAIYDETMDRVEAKQAYYFDSGYFTDLLMLGTDKLHLCFVEFENEIAAACLFFECCGIVQAHLGGTRNQFLPHSPFNLLLHDIRLWAKARKNNFLHIGSGVGGTKDSLFTFKSGFSRQRHQWFALRLITDIEKYQELVELRARYLHVESKELLASKYFPAYRF
jgi:Acetyltransferase (GNAT) domain